MKKSYNNKIRYIALIILMSIFSLSNNSFAQLKYNKIDLFSDSVIEKVYEFAEKVLPPKLDTENIKKFDDISITASNGLLLLSKENKKSEEIVVKIYNSKGKEVISDTIGINSKKTKSYNFTSFPKEVYTIRLLRGGNAIIKNFYI